MRIDSVLEPCDFLGKQLFPVAFLPELKSVPEFPPLFDSQVPAGSRTGKYNVSTTRAPIQPAPNGGQVGLIIATFYARLSKRGEEQSFALSEVLQPSGRND